ncbi:uncharacterized protein LOC110735778 [Chenopodium quinoa]|uniref:uncharacterized protein LOC110735778 n=1 Tax=Chenopodium quinoa TaxID=63459 RepID=UPI000B77194C|nr:uncharacterized protein LOC110735778 [Chenopodium quinoa]
MAERHPCCYIMVLPPQNYIKLNVDGHVPSVGWAGLGVVARDHRGELVAAAVKRIHLTQAEIAEAQAVRYALQLARRLEYSHIWIESDAQEVVHAIKTKSNGVTPFHLVIEDVKSDSFNFNDCIFSHVRRVYNTVSLQHICEAYSN